MVVVLIVVSFLGFTQMSIYLNDQLTKRRSVPAFDFLILVFIIIVIFFTYFWTHSCFILSIPSILVILDVLTPHSGLLVSGSSSPSSWASHSEHQVKWIIPVHIFSSSLSSLFVSQSLLLTLQTTEYILNLGCKRFVCMFSFTTWETFCNNRKKFRFETVFVDETSSNATSRLCVEILIVDETSSNGTSRLFVLHVCSKLQTLSSQS